MTTKARLFISVPIGVIRGLCRIRLTTDVPDEHGWERHKAKLGFRGKEQL
jgi:hypothetical protein